LTTQRVIFDARLGFEIKRGYAITFMFATPDLIVSWPKIALPYSTRLAEKAAELERKSVKIGLNFTFQARSVIREEHVKKDI
jgi:hypothetical protein